MIFFYIELLWIKSCMSTNIISDSQSYILHTVDYIHRLTEEVSRRKNKQTEGTCIYVTMVTNVA